MRKEIRFSYFAAAGISAAVLMGVVKFIEGPPYWRLVTSLLTLLLSVAMLVIRNERLKEIIGTLGYLSIAIISIAIPFCFSPSLSALVWMAALLYMCPLLVGIYPVHSTIILAITDTIVLCVAIFNGAEIDGGRTDLLSALFAMIICAVIAITARKAQETDIEQHARTIELLEDSNEELETSSMTDPLTGLFNKGYYEMILPKMIAAHHQYGLPLAAIFVDIDHFKSINDNYGHDMGDKALVALSDRLQRSFRKEEIIRFGGEEFLILLSVPAFTAVRRIEAVRQEIEKMVTEGISFTISAGVAEYDDEMADHDLAKAADEQMYRAKTTGRNKVCM